MLLQFIHCSKEIIDRLDSLCRLELMNELFLFSKPLLNLLAFSWDKRTRTCVTQEFFPSILSVLKYTSPKPKKRFSNYIFSYAKSPTIIDSNRDALYEFLSKIEQLKLEKRPQPMQLILQPELFESELNNDEGIDFNDQIKRKWKEFQKSNEDEDDEDNQSDEDALLAQILKENGVVSSNSETNEKKAGTMYEYKLEDFAGNMQPMDNLEGDDYFEEEEEMSYEEMKQKLPDYYFKTPKQKKKYFKKLTLQYKKKLEKVGKSNLKRVKLGFQLDQNTVQTFNRDNKLVES